MNNVIESKNFLDKIVSYIIYCDDRNDYLQKCIDSIFDIYSNEEECKNIPKFEIIVVNNNVKNLELIKVETRENKDPNKMVFTNEKRNRAFCLNTAIKKTSGDIILILDSDCILDKESTIKALEYMGENNLDSISFKFINFIDENNTVIRNVNFGFDNCKLKHITSTIELPILNGNYFFNKNIYNEIGVFEEEFGDLCQYVFGIKQLINKHQICIFNEFDSCYYKRYKEDELILKEEYTDEDNLLIRDVFINFLKILDLDSRRHLLSLDSHIGFIVLLKNGYFVLEGWS